MKVTSLLLTAIFSLLAFTIFPASAETGPGDKVTTVSEMTKEEYKEALSVLKDRAENLKEAKKNATTEAEKQKLKEDIKEVKNETTLLKEQAANGGIYIGGGALIIIILLILLLR